MSVVTQKVHLSKVWRTRRHHSGEMVPISQVFAFDANAVEDFAEQGGTDSHTHLLCLTIHGLWECSPKQTVLAGYIPGTIESPICRLFLMSKREIAWSNFYEVVRKAPGYLETAQDFTMGHQTNLLAWWEPPCTMVALWPELPEEFTGIPGALLSEFEHGGRTYRYLNRLFEVVDDAEAN